MSDYLPMVGSDARLTRCDPVIYRIRLGSHKCHGGVTATFQAYVITKRRGRAVITLNGKDHYLGQFGTPESTANADAIIQQWLANGRRSLDDSNTSESAELTVVELCHEYLLHAQSIYVKFGEPTDELAGIKAAIRRLREHYGFLPISALGPKKIQELRTHFAANGVSRYYIKKSIGRIKRMFKWAVSQELIPPRFAYRISSVAPLKVGQIDAYELTPVGGVDDSLSNPRCRTLRVR